MLTRRPLLHRSLPLRFRLLSLDSGLDVAYADKDTAKAMGARWDGAARRWFALPGRVDQLTAWAAAPALPDPLPGEDRAFGAGLFVDLIPTSCWFTNVRACVRPTGRG